MKVALNIPKARAWFESLPPEYAADPRTVEGADASFFDPDYNDEAEGGRYVLNAGKRDAALRELDALRLRDENDRLRDENDRRTVVDELRRNLRAVGVKPGLVDAAAAMFMQSHRFAIGDDGKVHVMGDAGPRTDCLQAAVRWIERDEHGDLKSRVQPDSEGGEFSRMLDELKH